MLETPETFVPARHGLVRAAAVVLAVVSVAALGLAAIVDAEVPGAQRDAIGIDSGLLGGLAGPMLAIPGLLLAWRVPRHPLTWVFCTGGAFWALDGLAGSWTAWSTLHDPPLAGGSLAYWVFQRLGASLLLLLPLVLLLYPYGRLPSGRWRPAATVSLAATSLLPVLLLVVPSRIAEQRASGSASVPVLAGLDVDPTSIGLPEPVWAVLLPVAYAAVPLSLVVPFIVVVQRFRRSTGLERTRMRWLLWAAVVDVLVMPGVAVAPPRFASVGLSVAVGVTAAAVAIGIARPNLVDIDRLLGGTLVYAALVAIALALDLATVALLSGALGEQLGEREAQVVAVLVVVAVYAPLRVRLWRLVRRLVLGERDDPYRVVSVLAERLERSEAPEQQLLAVARSVADAFRSPYVAVEVEHSGGELLVVEHGERPAQTQVLPISYRGEEIGRLVIAFARAGSRLSTADERLLGDVVRQAAAAARASQLAAALQRSREQLVTAREEERRRLRRDLHDGLGPSLGAVVMQIDTARNLAQRSPAESDRLLRAAKADVAASLADVRRLVHDLRPPALDDVGLLGAVRQQAERIRSPGLKITVDGGDDLDSLPAAVEVAAYRIASEALANVSRHSSAGVCEVRLAVEDEHLVVEVVDDGVGIDPSAAAGVGLVSLRERAAELGGDCTVQCPPAGGTRVRAALPVPA